MYIISNTPQRVVIGKYSSFNEYINNKGEI